MTMRVLVAALWLAASEGVAIADEPPSPPPIRFPSLGPDGARTELAVEGGIHPPGASPDYALFSADVAAQAMSAMGLGGYARINLTRRAVAPTLSNLEVGGLYRPRVRGYQLTLRAGVALPTGPGSYYDAYTTMLHSVARRPADLPAVWYDTTAARFAVSPAWRTGAVVVRGDVGVDVFLDHPGDFDDPAYHVDVAAGLQDGAMAATVELSSLGSFGRDQLEEGTYDALTLAGQLALGRTSIDAGVTFPFDTFDDGSDYRIGGMTLFVGVAATP